MKNRKLNDIFTKAMKEAETLKAGKGEPSCGKTDCSFNRFF